ncbi:TPA: ornithine carbamoyltransferase [archaeon]|uniref:Ornithine carbamoyltransferase n=1 Tax=Candidatus Naiadarchaeum limnaeum TaxID=2756139 RepID=A0A832UVE2_9ARCH|nr:ornithine carbamoyltransferase [Candidatus Naiadarchaeales archaeon SRR2090153.bin1042]HIK00415.1 ornithine carbamoyltransferase [Candidatus Naiadarchaeum limnaeum]
MGSLSVKHLISINDLSRVDIEKIFEKSKELKEKLKKEISHEELKGKTLAMIFEKPSTRTRASFEIAMTQLGGHAMFLSQNDLQLGRGESIADTAKVLSRYADAIMARTYQHETLLELAKNSSVPVINGLSDFEHPCQILGDLFSIIEHKGSLENLKLAWTGDGNNVCNSLIYSCAKLGIELSVATPKKYKPSEKVWKNIGSYAKSKISWTENLKEAVKNSDVIFTDTWVSMGQEKEKTKRLKIFKPYQVNEKLAKNAKPDYLFMHCLPAYRGYEVTADIIDGPHSIVLDEAENRLHVQKGILALLLK